MLGSWIREDWLRERCKHFHPPIPSRSPSPVHSHYKLEEIHLYCFWSHNLKKSDQPVLRGVARDKVTWHFCSLLQRTRTKTFRHWKSHSFCNKMSITEGNWWTCSSIRQIILGHHIKLKVSLQPEKDKISIFPHFEMKSKILLLIIPISTPNVFSYNT